MLGIVGFPQHEQPRDRTHQLVVNPESSHRVMGGGIDAHRRAIGIVAADPLVHGHQVAVAGGDDITAFAADRVGEIQVHRTSARTDAVTGVAEFPGAAGGDIPGGHVAVGGIHPLEEVIPLLLRDVCRGSVVSGLLRQPDATVVAQAFAHQRQLALEGITAGDAGGMDLGEAGVGEQRPLAVRPPDGAGV